MSVVSFTGHRPNKLGTGYSISNERVQQYSYMLRDTIMNLIRHEGATRFISGGAIGIDQIAFWTVEQLKESYPSIENILAVPFESQYSNWRNGELVEWYHKMVHRADSVIHVDLLEGYRDYPVADGKYSAKKMQLRNQYMVDNSDYVVAVWDGTSGGTANCVTYAESKMKQVIRLKPLTF
jgi:uncharacterized phage-like protein YoqJ